MNNQTDCSPNGIYFLNPQLNAQQLNDTINACLAKAEALAATAANIDFETYSSNTINDYLWALSDIIREAKWLYNESSHCLKKTS